MIFTSPIRVPPSWPHSAGCGGTDQGPEGAGHVAQSLRAVSPGSRHDAETLDLLSRNHAETHLWETKGNKLGHSRRSNASRFGVTPCSPSSNLSHGTSRLSGHSTWR